MIGIHVRGHSNVIKRMREQVKKDWKCPACSAFARYYWLTCPNCNHPRP